MNDDEYGSLLLRPLITEPPATTRVDVAEAMRRGRRSRHTRIWSRFSALTALTAAAATGGVLALTAPSDDPDPDLPPDPVIPAACTPVRLPTGGAASAEVTGGDPSGTYLVGTTNPDATTPDKTVLVWRDGKLVGSARQTKRSAVMSDINASGVAVGSTGEMTYLPYVYRDGKLSRLKGTGEAKAINNAGTIAGTHYAADGAVPVRWAGPGAEPEPMKVPDGTANGQARDIAEDGTIAVTLSTGNFIEQGYLWFPDGTSRAIEGPGAGQGKVTRFIPDRFRSGWLYGAVNVFDGASSSPGGAYTFETVGYRYHVASGTWQTLPPDIGAMDAFIGREKVTMSQPADRHEDDAYSIRFVADDGRSVAGGSFSNRANPDHPYGPYLWRCS